MLSRREFKEVTVNYGMTINRGNYESERVDLEVRASVGPEEDVGVVLGSLYEYLRTKAHNMTGGFRGKR